MPTRVVPIDARDCDDDEEKRAFEKKEERLHREMYRVEFFRQLQSFVHIETERNYFVIRSNHPIRLTWDAIIVFCLLYVFVITPLEVVYAEPSAIGWVWFGRVIDIVFWLDILICFRTTYSEKDGEIVYDSWKIAKHYASDFFLIDLISCLPGYPLGDLFQTYALGSTGSDSSSASIVKLGKAPRVLKVFRSVKMVKVLRVLRVARFLEDLRDTFSELVIFLKLLKLLVFTSFFLHLNACAFSLVAQSEDPRDSWVGENGPYDSWWSEYVNALYWSTSTSTTVGYGDVAPQTDNEKLFCVMSMAIGVGIYGYIIGSMTEVVTSTSFVEHRTQQRMDEIYCFLKKHPSFPRDLRGHVLKFYRNHFKKRKLIDEKKILDELPSRLLHQVKDWMVLDGMRTVPFFHMMDTQYFSRIINLLGPMTFHSGEIIIEANEEEHHSEFFVLTDGHVCIHKSYAESPEDKSTPSSPDKSSLVERFRVMIERVLSKYDVNHDGFIDRSELILLLTELNGNKEKPREKVVNTLMSDLKRTAQSNRIPINVFVKWYVDNRVKKSNKENGDELGPCVSILHPTCTFGTWTAFDLGKGELCPYSYVVEVDSTVDVCAICARELLDEFADCSDALDVIFTALVAPALKMGASVDVHHQMTEQECKRGVKKIQKQCQRTFSSRMLQSHFSIRANRRHDTQLHKADDADSSVMLALATEKDGVSSMSNESTTSSHHRFSTHRPTRGRSEQETLRIEVVEMKAQVARLAALLEAKLDAK